MDRPANQNNLIVVLIALLGLALGYFYHSNFQNTEVVEPLPPAEEMSFQRLKNLSINFSLLDNPLLQSLQINGEFPVSGSTIGKPDPFAP